MSFQWTFCPLYPSSKQWIDYHTAGLAELLCELSALSKLLVFQTFPPSFILQFPFSYCQNKTGLTSCLRQRKWLFPSRGAQTYDCTNYCILHITATLLHSLKIPLCLLELFLIPPEPSQWWNGFQCNKIWKAAVEPFQNTFSNQCLKSCPLADRSTPRTPLNQQSRTTITAYNHG